MTQAGFGDWLRGYSAAELTEAQERFKINFPPDLFEMLTERRPARAFDWRYDEQAAFRALAWPFEGLLSAVEKDGLWWPEWGERPKGAEDRADALRGVVSRAPPLIPIFSHRYIPAEPAEMGNPVFSIYQSDVVYYGYDLDDYLEREFIDPKKPFVGEPKSIRFWSLLVERSHKEPYYSAPLED